MTDRSALALEIAARIVAGYARNPEARPEEIPALLKSARDTVIDITFGVKASMIRQVPAVPVEQSVTPAYLICLEDGKRLKMLKHHLRTSYDMSPEQYRHKWGLPADYPMTAPDYSKYRSQYAKEIGLGRTVKAPE